MKILLISYSFPPLGQVGSLRLARFCRHQPSFGIEPIVLTVQERLYAYYDEGLPWAIVFFAIWYKHWLDNTPCSSAETTDSIVQGISAASSRSTAQ